MRVTVERSGGFAGITKTKSVDQEDLSPDDAKVMRELVQALDRSEGSERSPGRQPDRFEYVVTVETSGRSRTVAAGEAGASPALGRLIEWVMSTPGT
jgi:hypothetical protein